MQADNYNNICQTNYEKQRPADQKVQLAKLEEPPKTLSSTNPKEALAIDKKKRLDANIIYFEDKLKNKKTKSVHLKKAKRQEGQKMSE